MRRISNCKLKIVKEYTTETQRNRETQRKNSVTFVARCLGGEINSPVAVIGLGRVGRIVSQYLLHKQVYVYGYDENKNIFSQIENIRLMRNRFFKVMPSGSWLARNPKPKFAICSPGFSDNNKMIQSLKKNQIPIMDEIEFTSLLINRPIIAITGTNGKSTTTSLLGRILDTEQKNVFWGGNLAPGLPFAITLFQEPKDYYVIEVSSFQLERCIKFHPHIAVLLNITADHLNRHASLEEYQKVKFRIFANQTQKDYAIINFEDETSMKYLDSLRSKIIYFSKSYKTNGAYLNKNQIYFHEEKICSFDTVKLLGNHFINSILATISVAKLVGVRNQTIAGVLKNFAGLEHRLEFVAEINGVKYINNSMCTNPSAGVATLRSFAKPVILIAGGKEKNLDVVDYIKAITGKTRFTILIGDNRERLSQLLKQANYTYYQLADSLKQAVVIAQKYAKPNDIILFSPGFASFDNFTNFQERGKVFKEIVYDLE